jgi:hypothetical protein
MKVTRMIIIFLFCALTMGVSQCEGIELEYSPEGSKSCDSPPLPIAVESVIVEEPECLAGEEEKYLLAGDMNYCRESVFVPCKVEVLQYPAVEEPLKYCRDFCCTGDPLWECLAVCGIPCETEVALTCIEIREELNCNQTCLDSCRSRLDTCAEYYECCSERERETLPWQWRG